MKVIAGGPPPRQSATILLALASALLWGLWWLPIRALEDLGLGGVWAGLAMAAGGAPLLLAAALAGRQKPGHLTFKSLAGAFVVGLAVTFYATALTFTDVVRAVLLFYLAPTWSIALECLLLGRRWNNRALLALLLSFGGILFVFRGDVSLSGWNGGDLMALASGFCWSVGALLIFTAPPARSVRLSLATIFAAILTSVAALAIGGDAAGVYSATVEPIRVAFVAIGSGTIYMAPIILITLWAARRLPPATMSFILTAEIISGIASAALLADERFGWPEALGCTLVIAGALVEIVAAAEPRRPRPDTSD